MHITIAAAAVIEEPEFPRTSRAARHLFLAFLSDWRKIVTSNCNQMSEEKYLKLE